MLRKTVCLIIIIIFTAGVHLSAQPATVTFNINLQPELKNSVFIPGRDWIVITGNQYPFDKLNNRLEDSAPIDSIYSITLQFRSSDINKNLGFNYVMYIEGNAIREDMRREIEIYQDSQNLDPFYFNAFAW